MTIDYKTMLPRGIALRGNSLVVQSNKTTIIDGKKKQLREFRSVPIKIDAGTTYSQQAFMEAVQEAMKVKMQQDSYVASGGFAVNRNRKQFGVGKLKETYDLLFSKRWAGKPQERNISVYARDVLNFFPHDIRLDEMQTEAQRDAFIEFVREQVEKRPMNNYKTASNKSVNVRLGIIRAVCQYAIKEGLLNLDKVIDKTRTDYGWTDLPRTPAKKKRPLTDDEIEAVKLQAIKDGMHEFADAFVFLCDVGCRHKTEFHRLNMKNVDFKHNSIQFFRPKTNTWSVPIPLTDRVREMLLARREVSMRRGGKIFDISEYRIRVLCARYKTILNLPEHFTPYATRHTFITRLVEQDVPANIVKDLAGHNCIETTLSFYAISSDTATRKAIAKINTKKKFDDSNDSSLNPVGNSPMIGHNSKVLQEKSK